MYSEWKKIEFPPQKKNLSVKLETTRLRGRQRNRWQDEIRKDRRLVGGNWVEGKSTEQRGMGEAAENGNESSHSTHANE